MKKLSWRDSCSGFSLLEVLVAFAILAVALGALMQSFATGLRNTALAEEYSQALMHAESVLAGIGTEGDLSEAAELGGELDDIYSWRASAEEYVEEDESSDANIRRQATLYTVTVEVFWDSVGKRRSLALHTLRLAAVN